MSVPSPRAAPISSIAIRGARVVTFAEGPRPRRGADLGRLGVIDPADVFIVDDRVFAVARAGGAAGAPRAARHEEIDARGRVLLPGFVDCHTHACWTGSRLDEWAMALGGATYLDILEAGGGIMATVRAVREASAPALADSLLARLDLMLAEGSTTVEVKSGYGLTAEDEVKMLAAIHAAAGRWRGSVVSTALLGHAIDPGVPDFIARTIGHTLPAVSRLFPGITIDAYCERGAWTVADCLALFERAAGLGHPWRVHADQFTATGMIPRAVERSARSVDHLEATTPEDLRLLASSGTFGVMLPACGFHLDGRYADGRAFVDAGGALAIATNANPGSAPVFSMPLVLALAVRHLGLTPAEALAAATVNPATLLGLTDRGVIAPGMRADLVLLRHTDERALAHEVGAGSVDLTLVAGRVAWARPGVSAGSTGASRWAHADGSP